MKKREITLLTILFIGALFLAISGKKPLYDQEIHPNKLAQAAVKKDRVINADELAEKLILKDPTIQLIDVRSPEEYEAFSLPGAINIPLDSLLNEEFEPTLTDEVYHRIFFSHGNNDAAKAWLICARVGYTNNSYLEGGLNQWVKTILRPESPAEIETIEAIRLYNKRRAASMFFGGGTAVSSSSNGSGPAVKITRKKKEASGGGCD